MIRNGSAQSYPPNYQQMIYTRTSPSDDLDSHLRHLERWAKISAKALDKDWSLVERIVLSDGNGYYRISWYIP